MSALHAKFGCDQLTPVETGDMRLDTTEDRSMGSLLRGENPQNWHSYTRLNQICIQAPISGRCLCSAPQLRRNVKNCHITARTVVQAVV